MAGLAGGLRASAATPDTILGYYTISPGAIAFAKATVDKTVGKQALPPRRNQDVPPRLCRYISIAIGSTDTNTIPIATNEKLSLTTGTLPNA